jgi:hypothetical protein
METLDQLRNPIISLRNYIRDVSACTVESHRTMLLRAYINTERKNTILENSDPSTGSPEKKAMTEIR